MDQAWIKLGHIRSDVVGPFRGSRMAIGGPHMASKWPKMAINGPFGAISRFGSYKLVDQCGPRMDYVEAHPGRCVGTFCPSGAIRGHHRASKRLKKARYGHKQA